MNKEAFIKYFFVALVFFSLGFLANHFIGKINNSSRVGDNQEERIPVDPRDFDHNNMLDALSRMNEEDGFTISPGTDINRREDDRFVYYDIPLMSEENGTIKKLNVEVKEGMVHIKEDVKSSDDQVHSSSERMFSLDPGLDGNRAEVLNEKDKITIKIPKK